MEMHSAEKVGALSGGAQRCLDPVASHVNVGISESWESAAVDQLAVKRGTGIKRQPDHVFLRSV